MPKKVLIAFAVIGFLFFFGCSPVTIKQGSKIYDSHGLFMGTIADSSTINNPQSNRYLYLISPKGYQYILTWDGVYVPSYSYFVGKDKSGHLTAYFTDAIIPPSWIQKLFPVTSFKSGKYTTIAGINNNPAPKPPSPSPWPPSPWPPSPDWWKPSPWPPSPWPPPPPYPTPKPMSPNDARYCVMDVSMKSLPAGVDNAQVYTPGYYQSRDIIAYQYYLTGNQFITTGTSTSSPVFTCDEFDVGLPTNDVVKPPFHDEDGNFVPGL